MRSILIISKEDEVFRVIHTCFRSESRVDEAFTKGVALDMLQKQRYDFLFIDLEILREPAQGNGYKIALQPFWHLFPGIEIIIISSQDMIREAVMAVKAGASN